MFSYASGCSDAVPDADADCYFPSNSEAQATTDAIPVWVAISHVCAPETSCSSAKVLVTDAGVGPGT